MKKLIVFILLLLGYSSIYSQKERIDVPCATDALHFELMKTKASYKERFEKDNSQWQEHAKKGFGENLQRSVPLTEPVTLTVAFHNMTNNSSAVVNYDQAISNLDAIFNLLNIDFCRAYQDINGNSFNNNVNVNVNGSGISSLANNQSAINSFITNVGVIDEFPTERYINIYIFDAIIPSTVAGFAYLPSAHGENYDGIYIREDALFSETLTHEMGHYLGLHHVFGICNPDDINSLNVPDPTNPPYNYTNPCSCNNDNCLFNGDMICDTPPSMLDKLTCVSNSCHTDSSPSVSDGTHPDSDVDDDKQNFMDYSNCRNHFTDGQFLKMQFTVDPEFGIRKSLLQTQACSSCPDMSGCSITIEPLNNNSMGQNVNHTFNATLSNCTASSSSTVENISWVATNLDTNSVVQSTSNPSEFNFSEVGNYQIEVTYVFSTTPYCAKTKRYAFQVVPAFESSANCPTVQFPANEDWGNWRRVSYKSGWNRDASQNHGLVSGHRYSSLDSDFDSDGFEIISGNSINDANFNNIPIPAISGTPLPVIRVGREIILNEPSTHNPGDAYYASYTFTPTQENCKFRVHYLGMAEFSNTPQIDFNNSVLVNSNDTSFGVYSQYQFDSPLSSSPLNAFYGNSEVGNLDYAIDSNQSISFPNPAREAILFPENYNQLIYGKPNSAQGQISYNGYTRTNGWKYVDLDYSEFANPNVPVEVTLTFFSRSNTGLDGNANKHSYGYFAVECLGGGTPKHLDIDFPDIQIPCSHPNSASSCYTQEFELPLESRIPHYYDGNDYNNIVNLTVTNLTNTTSNQIVGSFNYLTQKFEFKICLTSSSVPFEDFQVTFQTLNQTITDTIRVFYGYYYSICTENTGGNYTDNTPREKVYCPNTNQSVTFMLTNPCSIPNVPMSEIHYGAPNGQFDYYYEWLKVDTGGTVSYSSSQTFTSYTINGTIPYNNNCNTRIFRRFYKKDIYCGGYMQFDSPSFYLYPLIRRPNFAINQVNACANETINVQFTGVDISNCIFDQEILQQYLQNNSQSSDWTLNFEILGPNNSPIPGISPQNMITLNSSTTVFPSFTFNNLNASTNTFIYPAGSQPLHIRWILKRFGCNPIEFTGASNVVVNIEPTAEGGLITQGIANCPSFTFNNVGSTPASSGFTWQYSTSNAPFNWNAFAYTGAINPQLSYYMGGLGLSPILYIRRVSRGIGSTGNCGADAYSNTLAINPTGLPYFNEVKTICSSQELPTLPTSTLYNNIHGIWSEWIEGQDSDTGYTTYTSSFTVNTNYLLCVPPGYNSNPIVHTIMVLPEGHPDCECLSDLVLTSNDNSSGIGFAHVFFRNKTIVAENGYKVYGEDNIEMHAGDYIELLPDTMFGTIHHFMAYIEGCPTLPKPKESDINNNNEINISKQLVVFPNPTNGDITIMMKNAKFNNVTISTIDGKIIYRKTLDKTAEFKFNLDAYPQSIYIISVIDENGDNYFEKVIKN